MTDRYHSFNDYCTVCCVYLIFLLLFRKLLGFTNAPSIPWEIAVKSPDQDDFEVGKSEIILAPSTGSHDPNFVMQLNSYLLFSPFQALS